MPHPAQQFDPLVPTHSTVFSTLPSGSESLGADLFPSLLILNLRKRLAMSPCRLSVMPTPKKIYLDYDEMLSDDDVDAVIIAVSDAFHVPAAMKALSAGKHV